MTDARKLVVYDVPTSKGRPRVAVRAGRAHAYMPASTLLAEWRIRDAWITAYGEEPSDGPLLLVLGVWLPIPTSVAKKRRATAEPVTRPDLDNYLKLALDALNGVAFKDDSQIVRIVAAKHYVRDARVPRWELEVSVIG